MREIKRISRTGAVEYYPTDEEEAKAARALVVLRAAVERHAREERAALRARQEAGRLTPQERLLSAIFGEISNG